MNDNYHNKVKLMIESLISSYENIIKYGFKYESSIFQKENIALYDIPVDEYKDQISGIIGNLKSSLDILSGNKDEYAIEVYKSVDFFITDRFSKMSWMLYSDRKPSRDEIKAQVNVYLQLVGLSAYQLSNILHSSKNIKNEIDKVGIAISLSDINAFIVELNEKKNIVDDIVKDIEFNDQLRRNHETGLIYISAQKRYRNRAILFGGLSLIFSFLTLCVLIINDYGFLFDSTGFGLRSDSSTVNIVMFKISSMAIFGGISAYLWRLTSFYYIRSEKAYFTSLELRAFPSYVIGFSDNDKKELRKKLISSYFGKEMDEGLKKKLSTMAHEQINISKELINTMMEIIKVNKKDGNDE